MTQERWSDFCGKVEAAVTLLSDETHFAGFSPTNAKWQNAAWIFEMNEGNVNELRRLLGSFCNRFGQDSIALTTGETEMVRW